MKLTFHQLSERSGEPVERLQQWHSLGLIGRQDSEEVGPEDVHRVRLVQLLLRRGVSLEAIVQADKEQRLLARYMETMFPGGPTRSYSLDEAIELTGFGREALRRLWEASGLGGQGESIGEDDLEVLRGMKVALDAGFPEDALLQLARVYSDAPGRVAEAEVRMFHFYVHERLRAAGLSGPALADASGAARQQTAPLIEPLILHFHRKGWERAIQEDAVMHLQQDTGLVEKLDVPGQLRVAVVFVDLSSFTALVEAMGDQTAVDVLGRFSQLVREAVSRWEGRVVKQIGDAFMLVFPEPRSAVACACEIERLTAAEPQFPAVRSGAHWGPVLYREGDYVGATINVAARLAAEAQRHQILVTAAVRKEAGSLPDVEFVPLGRQLLKGVPDEVELFEVVPGAREKAAQRPVDPVCGMELGAGEAAARLSLEARDYAFCSQDCLQRFVAAPERYGARRRSP